MGLYEIVWNYIVFLPSDQVHVFIFLFILVSVVLKNLFGKQYSSGMGWPWVLHSIFNTIRKDRAETRGKGYLKTFPPCPDLSSEIYSVFFIYC